MERIRSKRRAEDPAALYAELLRDPTAYGRRMAEKHKAKHEKGSGVGYCQPPKHSQWKPGQSGNPLGRRVGSANLKTLVQRVFSGTIKIRSGDTVRKVTRLEATMLAGLNNAMKGDHRAIREVLAIAKSLGVMDDHPQKLVLGDLSDFTTQELLDLSSLLRKAGARTVPSK